MNVTGAWAQGYTGKGITVTILDDGVESNHPDLKANFAGYASYDRNDNDNDPTPRYNPSNENRLIFSSFLSLTQVKTWYSLCWSNWRLVQ